MRISTKIWLYKYRINRFKRVAKIFMHGKLRLCKTISPRVKKILREKRWKEDLAWIERIREKYSDEGYSKFVNMFLDTNE